MVVPIGNFHLVTFFYMQVLGPPARWNHGQPDLYAGYAPRETEVLLGDQSHINSELALHSPTSARRMRNLLGEGMRQAGVVTARGLHCLRDLVQHLATQLAQRLAKVAEVEIDLDGVQTNLVVFRQRRMPNRPFLDRMRTT